MIDEGTAAIVFVCTLLGMQVLWFIFGKIQVIYMHFEEEKLSKKEFRLADGFYSDKTSESAGCIVEYDGKIVFVEHPFNFHNFWCSWRHSIPGGKVKKGLKAWQAAALETFEETGIEVEIQEEIAQFGDFVLFLGKPIKPIDPDHFRSFKKTFEISKIMLKDPSDLKHQNARFPKQHLWVQEWHKNRGATNTNK